MHTTSLALTRKQQFRRVVKRLRAASRDCAAAASPGSPAARCVRFSNTQHAFLIPSLKDLDDITKARIWWDHHDLIAFRERATKEALLGSRSKAVEIDEDLASEPIASQQYEPFRG